MVAQTRGGQQPSHSKLKFNDKLVGKGFSTDTLLKKLKALHTELADLDQELVDASSLGNVRKELVHTTILLHKDRGVKAYNACCLADLLRLYAPDAPYTHNELRDIFQFFFRQLTAGLKGPDSPYYQEYFHLLESLSTVKSVVLVCDLPNAEELMTDIFRDFFSLVRQDLAKKIEIFMADILVALVDEANTLPLEVLESIMAQFMDKHAGMDNPAYRLAVQVCNQTADKLQRHVCQYFTDIIVSHSQDDDDFSEIRTAHDLIKRLNRTCPALLHNVIPQLEEELRVEDIQLRSLATQTLGEMFADKGGSDLAKKYPTTWNAWLMRKNDKSTAVRLLLVEAAKGLIVNLADQRDVIEEALSTKLLDPDEKVRSAVCKLYSQLDYETALHHVSVQQLKNVAGRGLDKKRSVRIEAMNSIGKLYSIAFPEIENGDPAATQQFAWIPQTILHMCSTTLEVKVAVEHVMAEYILPLPTLPTGKNTDLDEAAWTDRLLSIMRFLDTKAIKSLLAMSGIKGQRPTIYERFIECCEKNNGGIIDENEEEVQQKLTLVVRRLSGSMPDPLHTGDDLRSFAKMNEARLYKLLRTCMDTQSDLKTLVKASTEFLRRLEQSSPSVQQTMATFLRRASLWLINQSSIPILVKRLQRGDPAGDGYGTSQAQLSANNAEALLTFVSKHCPSLYKQHVSELTKAIADEKNPRLVEVCLQALAAIAQWDEKLAPSDKRTTDRVIRFALESNHRYAKFSSRLLAKSKNSDKACARIVNTISEELSEVDADELVAHIAVLQEFVRAAPDAFEEESEVIMGFLIKHVLMSQIAPDPDDMDVDTEWAEDENMRPSLRAKLLSVKVCRNRCLAHADSDNALDIATPVMKMLFTLLENGGSLAGNEDEDPKVKSRMRLQAATSLLHLAKVAKYNQHISQNFITLAITMQDPCYQVRMGFLSKLIAFLQSQALPSQFNTIPFLTIHDPEADIKSTAKAYVSFAFRTLPASLKVQHFEMMFVRFLHLLAHHPDFALTQESLPDMAKYIDFYLELIASPENVSLLYHIAGKVKTVRDIHSQGHSENMYALSELAQYVIRARAQSHSWALPSYPGKVKMFSDILRPLPNAQATNEILKRIYLPSDTLDWLKDQAKQAKVADAENKPKSRRKRKAPAPRANGAAKRSRRGSTRRKRRNADESSEEDEDEEDEESPDEGSEDQQEQGEDAGEAKSESSPEENDEPKEERLGRGARTRANAKIKQQVSKKKTPRKR